MARHSFYPKPMRSVSARIQVTALREWPRSQDPSHDPRNPVTMPPSTSVGNHTPSMILATPRTIPARPMVIAYGR
ncbi:hypothetical protein BMS3Bbin01_00920 [bacterium BMS3Bbin01]|nr:hypothetical protein BMS3Bbin01_00920 [bacterium BMS3Bbin01]